MTRAEPKGQRSEAENFCDYLDFYRATVEAKLRSLEPAQLRESALPSGWTPLEMLQHLVFMERRWFVWAFLGEDVPDPFGDRVDGVRHGAWAAGDDVTLEEALDRLHAGGRRTREIVLGSPLETLAPPGPRFRPGEEQDLRWICFHVLQEYARHAGHLDAAVELMGGATGQ